MNELLEKKIQESEIKKLASEMKASGVSDGKGVSNYIKTRELAKQFPHITGQLTIGKFGEPGFVCEGGVLPNHYGRLCEALGIAKQETNYIVNVVSSNKSAISNTANSDWGEYFKLMPS
jgi:hypothetical protein